MKSSKFVSKKIKSKHRSSKNNLYSIKKYLSNHTNFISKVLSLIVALGGMVVMFGWIFNVSVLTSILPIWVSMKFITALSFFASGVLVFLLAQNEKNEMLDYFTLVISFSLVLLMVVFLFSLFSGVSTGIESLFVKEASGAVKTTVPGVPAIPTIICFILIGLSKLGSMFFQKSSKIFMTMGVLIALIGGIAVLGYIFGIPQMYYTFPGYTSMAFHTSLLFVLIGIALILIRKIEGEASIIANSNEITK